MWPTGTSDDETTRIATSDKFLIIVAMDSGRPSRMRLKVSMRVDAC